ncbi:concanavalin A-like lectin/glucanase domain-containing protein [Blastocladiella britannica]|nr:concanavalin A-like lectin/glucanase domain-containing protein [Blastocladiella britannica]
MTATLQLATLAVLAAMAVLAPQPARAEQVNCFNYGHPCPATTPFCNEALKTCSSSLWYGYSSNGCVANASYAPDSCGEISACRSARYDFDDPNQVTQLNNYQGNPDKQPFIDDTGNTYIQDGQLFLNMQYNAQAGRGLLSRVVSTRKYYYGNYTARIRASEGKGFIYTWIWKSNLFNPNFGDELDWEFVPGYRKDETQTNMFTMGREDFHYGRYHLIENGNKSVADWHTYGFYYTPEVVQWTFDGVVVRSQTPNATNPIPRHNGWLFASIWDTCQQQPGTIEWAGGPSEWCGAGATDASKKLAWRMAIDYIDVQCLNGTYYSIIS